MKFKTSVYYSRDKKHVAVVTPLADLHVDNSFAGRYVNRAEARKAAKGFVKRCSQLQLKA